MTDFGGLRTRDEGPLGARAEALQSSLAVGLVGCGRLAEHGYVPAFRGACDVHVAAVADPDPARRAHIAGLAGLVDLPDSAHVARPAHSTAASTSDRSAVPAFAGAGELLEHAQVNALILATPAGAHVADARLAATMGIAVLVEKPPAVDAAAARELAALTPPPWVGCNRRFEPGVGALRSAVPAQGPVDLRLTLHYRRRSWRAHRVADDALLDLGPHLVDLARWLTCSDVLSVSGARLSHERARLVLHLERGRALVDCGTDRPYRERIEVRDARGGLIASHCSGGIAAGLRGRVAPPREHPLVASLQLQLEAFAAEARRRSPLRSAQRREPSRINSGADRSWLPDEPESARAATAAGRPEDGHPLERDQAPRLATAADGVAVMTVLDAVRASAAVGARRTPVT